MRISSQSKCLNSLYDWFIFSNTVYRVYSYTALINKDSETRTEYDTWCKYALSSVRISIIFFSLKFQPETVTQKEHIYIL